MEVEDGRALVAAFRAMEPSSDVVSLARKLGGGVLSMNAQTFFLEKCLNDETCKSYPPAWMYLRRLLKQFILAAENDGEEVLDSLYELHAIYLLPSQEASEIAPKCYKSFTYRVPAKARAHLALKTSVMNESEDSEQLITLRVSLNMLEGDTGCCTWPAGLYLSEFILTHPELFHGQKCLEVGAGAGMVGILLARLGASKVTLTDGSLATLANMRHNLVINGVNVEGAEQDDCNQESLHPSTRVICQQLPWETLSERDLQALGSNVILGADLIYDPTYIPHLVRLLASLLSLGHPSRTNDSEFIVHEYPVAYIASAIRNPDSLIYFVKTVKEAGLRMTEVSESMCPLRCFPQISSLDRSKILVHRLQAWKD